LENQRSALMGLPVLVIPENRLPPVTPIHHVIYCPRIFHPQFSRHAQSYPNPGKYFNIKNRPEWPLVKAAIIAGSAFPIATAVGDFHKCAAGPVEQRVRFWAALDRSGFPAVGTVTHQVARQIVQEVLP